MAARNLLFTIAGNVHTNTLASQFYNFNSGTFSGITKLTTGAVVLGYVGQTSTYAVLDGDHTINCLSGTFTVTLPTAVGRAGQVFFIKNSGAGTITVATTSSQTIDGASTVALEQYKGVQVQSTGAQWIVVSTNVIPTTITFSQISDPSSALTATQGANSAADLATYLAGTSPSSGSASPPNSIQVNNGIVTSLS